MCRTCVEVCRNLWQSVQELCQGVQKLAQRCAGGGFSMFPNVLERWDKKNSVLNYVNIHNTFINQH
jgi:uncharacterized protein YukE